MKILESMLTTSLPIQKSTHDIVCNQYAYKAIYSLPSTLSQTIQWTTIFYNKNRYHRFCFCLLFRCIQNFDIDWRGTPYEWYWKLLVKTFKSLFGYAHLKSMVWRSSWLKLHAIFILYFICDTYVTLVVWNRLVYAWNVWIKYYGPQWHGIYA